MTELALDSVALLAVRSAEIIEKVIDSLGGDLTEQAITQNKKLYDAIVLLLKHVSSTSAQNTVALALPTQLLTQTLKKSEMMLADTKTLRYLSLVLRRVIRYLFGVNVRHLHLVEFLRPYIIVGSENLTVSQYLSVPLPLAEDKTRLSAEDTEIATHLTCLTIRLIAYRIYEKGSVLIEDLLALSLPEFSIREVHGAISGLQNLYPEDESLAVFSQSLDSETLLGINHFLKQAPFILKSVLEHPSPLSGLYLHVNGIKRNNFWLNLILSGDINPGVLLDLPTSLAHKTELPKTYLESEQYEGHQFLKEAILGDPQVETMLEGALDEVKSEDLLCYLEENLLIHTSISGPVPSRTSKLSLIDIDEKFLEDARVLIHKLKKTLPRLSLNVRSIKYAIKKESCLIRELP